MRDRLGNDDEPIAGFANARPRAELCGRAAPRR